MTDIEIFQQITSSANYQKTKNFRQHGIYSVYEHSIYVCQTALKLSDFLHLKINRNSLTKAALLHDYFLYDWHDKESPKLHGFRHAKIAADNAKRDYGLTKKEYRIIASHMFPLGWRIPTSKEAILLTLADKYCATMESFRRKAKTKK